MVCPNCGLKVNFEKGGCPNCHHMIDKSRQPGKKPETRTGNGQWTNNLKEFDLGTKNQTATGGNGGQLKKIIALALVLILILIFSLVALGGPSDQVVRISGKNVVYTAFDVADMLKDNLNVSRFKTILVSRSDNYPDALSGSYLAAKRSAPMLLVSEDTVRDVRDYIEDSIAYGGTVYLLGDADVVPDAVVKGIEGITVRRLGGETRLETNLNILQEAEITEREIIVCSGWSYADSLSASVLDRPVLLVGENLTAEQEAFLKSLSSNLKFYIIGGSSAVSNAVQAALSNYGTTMRVSGENRCETSANVARKFFTAPEAVVLIYSHDFAEGLCSIPLALSMKAPLILTNPNDAGYCMEYMEDLEIHNGVIVAGEDTVPDALVVNIFQLEDASEIKNN